MNTTAEAIVKTSSLDDDFVAMLEELHAKDDRAALAALRRGLGKQPGEAMETYRHVARFAVNAKNFQHEKAFHTVATLFGLYPSDSRRGDHWAQTNLGASLRELKNKVDGEGAERRFVALLNSHTDELDDHLRHIISLLKSKKVSVNWRQLLADIRWWDGEGRDVQRKWAKAFWGDDRPEKVTK